jgi:hypothetical protein
LTSRPPLPEEGPLNVEATPDEFEAPKAGNNQDGNEVKGSLERSDSMVLPSLVESETQAAERKQKCTEELTSLGTSNPKYAPREKTIVEGFSLDIFGLLDL